MNAGKYSGKWPLVLAVMGLLACSPGWAQSTAETGKVHSGSSAAVLAWQNAMQKSDIKAIERMHTPQTVIYGLDSAVTRGDKAIMDGYKAMFARYAAHVEIRDAGWVRQGPLLNSWGQFVMTLTPKEGGENVRIEGRFSDVAVWRDNHWQYVMDHASVPSK